jgi:hypothetical protein
MNLTKRIQLRRTADRGLRHCICTHLLMCSLAVILQPLQGLAQQNSDASKTSRQPTPIERDGQHDFDFSLGTWKTHISRRLHPLTGSTTWVEYEGTSVVRKIWNGRGSLGETEADGPAGHLEALSLRLYNPEAHQWNLTYANSKGGTLSVPTIGEFKNGRGDFFDTELFNGRNILVRNVWSDITPNSCHFEQAFSDDGGKTWEVNWSATDTRVADESAQARTSLQPSPTEPDRQHDFDFAVGTWKTHLSRLQHPLTGSTTWVEYEGTSDVRRVWNGRANLEEFEAHGSVGHIEGLTLRLYNPQSHQWNNNWATSNDGAVNQPMIGEFKNGRGEFFDQEPFNGRAIYVRWVWSDITPNSGRFEQAFSDDGGKTWEVNWVNTYTRVGNEPDQTH